MSEIVVLHDYTICFFRGCEDKAVDILGLNRGSYAGVHPYCQVHLDLIHDLTSPEYTVNCPNCGCLYFVN